MTETPLQVTLFLPPDLAEYYKEKSSREKRSIEILIIDEIELRHERKRFKDNEYERL